MQVEKTVGTIETNLVGNDFRIQLTRESFRNMVGNIYSDQIVAIIRELACNAYDSHVAAGCPDKKFRIHLPNHFEPFFEIEDFGVGLDHDEIVNVYTVLYNSTKDNSNDFVGAFGIGSKSPFIYVDNFNVRARKNGIERNYAMFMSEQGRPSFSLMGEFETDEPNGVTVQFPVQVKDIGNFKESAKKVFKYFDTKPNCLTFEDYRNECSYTGITNNYEYFIKKNDYGYSGFVMGNVFYPHIIFQGLICIIKVPIGTFEVAMSRENILRNDKNNDTIANITKFVKQHFTEKFNEKIVNSKTYFEACHETSKLNYYLRNLLLNNVLKWNDKTINSDIILLKDLKNQGFSDYDLSEQILMQKEYKKSFQINGISVIKIPKIIINDSLSDYSWMRAKKAYFNEIVDTILYTIDKPCMKMLEDTGLIVYCKKASEVEVEKIKRESCLNGIYNKGVWKGYELTGSEEGIIVLKSEYKSAASMSMLQTIINQVSNNYNFDVEIYGLNKREYEKQLAITNNKLKTIDKYMEDLKNEDKEYLKNNEKFIEMSDYINDDVFDTVIVLDLEPEIRHYKKKLQDLKSNLKFMAKRNMFEKNKNLESSILSKKYPILKYFSYIHTAEDAQMIRKIVDCYHSSLMNG